MTIDWTLVTFELVNFGVLVAILTRFVFRPLRAAMDQRARELAEHEQEARARELAAEAEREQLARELASIEALTEQRVRAALAEAQGQAEQIVERARQLGRERIAEAERDSAGERSSALVQFRREVIAIANEAARRVMLDLGAPEIGLAYARRGLHALIAELGERRIAGALRVEISGELDTLEVGALVRQALPGVLVELVREPELVSGVRLLADGHEVRASACASLERWYEGLIGAQELGG